MPQKAKRCKRRFNAGIIKRNISYSFREIADLLGIHIGTINNWRMAGLKTIDKQKPFLVFGADLIDFINRNNRKNKQKCKPDEFYCCKCKQPQQSWENQADIKIINAKRLMIIGLCTKCGTVINKIGAVNKITEYKKIFNIQVIHNKHLIGCVNTSSRIDLNEVKNDKI
jgi:hypothetical protein